MKKIISFLLFIFVLWGLSLLMPTDDDWGYFTTPYWGDCLIRMYPQNNFWRPFDGLFGWILGFNISLFPFLNHLCILIAHCLSAYLIYKLCVHFRLRLIAIYIGVLYYLFSPAILGTILGIDSLNQAYASFWGICSLYLFVTFRGYFKIGGWIICALLSIFSKENGAVWLFIPPLVSLLNENSGIPLRKHLVKYWSIGISVFIVYICVRKSIELGTIELGNENSPYHFSLKNKTLDLLSFIGGSFLAIDFISILHKPSRNLLIASFTLLANIPFLWLILKYSLKHRKEKFVVILLLSAFIAAAPHLITHFGPMHAYSSLSLISLFIAFVVNRIKNVKLVKLYFLIFLVSALFVDIHHWLCTYTSSRIGMEMAQKVVRETKVLPNTVLIITIEDGAPRYSSFCVPPRDAYREGRAVQFAYKYKYPQKEIHKYLQKNSPDSINYYLNKYKHSCDCAWINYGDSVNVINF